MPDRRFFVQADSLRSATQSRPEERVVLIEEGEHHHLSRVLRLRGGDEVSVFDGQGAGYLGVIESVGRDSTRVRLTRPDERSVEPAFSVTLLQGIPHHDKMDLLVQKTTEVGVARLVPLLARRSVVRMPQSATSRRLERWRRVAREAARQSGRLRVPVVSEPMTLEEFVRQERAALAGGGALFGVSPDDMGQSSSSGAAGLLIPRAVVAVGPEGGWTSEEIALAVSSGFERVNLGPRVLRTETAGLLAVALTLWLAGDFGGFPLASSPR